MSSALFKMLSLVSFADNTDDMAASRTSSLDTCSGTQTTTSVVRATNARSSAEFNCDYALRTGAVKLHSTQSHCKHSTCANTKMYCSALPSFSFVSAVLST
jgi:hypothetical protein